MHIPLSIQKHTLKSQGESPLLILSTLLLKPQLMIFCFSAVGCCRPHLLTPGSIQSTIWRGRHLLLQCSNKSCWLEALIPAEPYWFSRDCGHSVVSIQPSPLSLLYSSLTCLLGRSPAQKKEGSEFIPTQVLRVPVAGK